MSSFILEVVVFQNPSLLSFAIAFVSYLVQFSWHPLVDFYGFYGISLKFLWNFYGFSRAFL